MGPLTKESLSREWGLLEGTPEKRVMRSFGFFGHYLHVHAGGRSGKQHILTQLLHCGGHLTQRELQDSYSISSAALSEVLAKLEAEGLVTRTRSEQDRRQLEIALTPTGSTVAREETERRLAFVRDSLDALTPPEREQLASLLERVEQSWQKKEDDRRETPCEH